MKTLSAEDRAHIKDWIEKTWNSYNSEDSDPVEELLDIHDAQQIEIKAQQTEIEWLKRERQEVREVLGVHGSDTMTAPAARGVMIEHDRQRKMQLGEFLSIEKHVEDLMSRIEKMERITHQACPCLHTTPCDERCTCVNGWSSSGCSRCCSYGSKEQRKAKAEHLVNGGAVKEQVEKVLNGFIETIHNPTVIKLNDRINELEVHLDQGIAEMILTPGFGSEDDSRKDWVAQATKLLEDDVECEKQNRKEGIE